MCEERDREREYSHTNLESRQFYCFCCLLFFGSSSAIMLLRCHVDLDVVPVSRSFSRCAFNGHVLAIQCPTSVRMPKSIVPTPTIVYLFSSSLMPAFSVLFNIEYGSNSVSCLWWISVFDCRIRGFPKTDWTAPTSSPQNKQGATTGILAGLNAAERKVWVFNCL